MFSALPPFFYDFDAKGKFSTEHSFDPKGYMRIAVALQELGRDEAIKVMRTLAKRHDGNKVVALCRMLFVARKDGSFRAPGWGKPATMLRSDGEKWPLEPIAIVKGVPILITCGYRLAGLPEPAENYLDYCVAKCDWRTQSFFNGRQKVIELAFAKLLVDVSPEGSWFNEIWIELVQTQVKHSARLEDPPIIWSNDSSKISRKQDSSLPGDFKSRRAALRKTLSATFDIKSIPPEREADFYEILTLYLRKSDDLYNLITDISFSAPDKARLNFFDDISRHGGGASLSKMIGLWSAEFFHVN